jgi:DNA relaxase NicK
MSDDKPAKTRPSHTAYMVRDYTTASGEADSAWSRIGVAFQHKDGMGFDVVLDATPVNGRVVLRSNELAEAKRQVRELLRAAEDGDG